MSKNSATPARPTGRATEEGSTRAGKRAPGAVSGPGQEEHRNALLCKEEGRGGHNMGSRHACGSDKVAARFRLPRKGTSFLRPTTYEGVDNELSRVAGLHLRLDSRKAAPSRTCVRETRCSQRRFSGSRPRTRHSRCPTHFSERRRASRLASYTDIRSVPTSGSLMRTAPDTAPHRLKGLKPCVHRDNGTVES